MPAQSKRTTRPTRSRRLARVLGQRTPKENDSTGILEGQKTTLRGKNGDIQVIWRKRSILKPYAKNAMIHSPEQVQQVVDSIRAFGWVTPIVVDEENNILAGHARNLAARKMDMELVPVIVKAGLTEEQKTAYRIADNKIARNSEFDLKVVYGELKTLPSDEFNLTGFNLAEFEQMAEPANNVFVIETPPPSDKFAEGEQFKANRPVTITMRCAERDVTVELKTKLEVFCKEFNLTCNIKTG